jgi:uncharacterized protein YcnI
MRLRVLVAVIAGIALGLAPPAWGHVTVSPSSAIAGSFTLLEIRVPNEEQSANTVKIDVKLPDGFAEASYQPVPGWTVEVRKRKLTTPIQTDDGPVSEEVTEIIWTGDGSEAGKISPGQFMDFPLQVQIPDAAGQTLTFPAIQTYDDGLIVRWIGPVGADQPAPRLSVMASVSGGSGRDGLTLGLAIGGLALGLTAVALARRKRV